MDIDSGMDISPDFLDEHERAKGDFYQAVQYVPRTLFLI